MNEISIIKKENVVYEIELLSPCGLYCGVCNQFLKEPKKCGGCYSQKGFAKTERKLCGIVKCTKNQNIKRCNECEIFPNCERLIEFQTWDSFISHAPVIENLKLLNEVGVDDFLDHLCNSVENDKYPPNSLKKITLKNLWKLIKPPYKPQKKNCEIN